MSIVRPTPLPTPTSTPLVRVLDGPAVDLAPTAVGVLDVERRGEVRYPVSPPAAHHVRTRLLLRRNGIPLGFVEVDSPSGVLPEGVAERAVAALAAARPVPAQALADRADSPSTPAVESVAEEAAEPASAPASGDLTVSVVVCTRDRADLLRRCLRSILDHAGADVEVVVVDNAPTTDATRRVVAGLSDSRLRYVLEPRAGLSVARNRGVREARSALVAFTDDDVVVDDRWLQQVVAAATPGVGCVTGLVPSAELETRWQHYFERRISWGTQLTPQLFRRDDDRGPLYPYSAGIFGTGANLAITRSAYQRIGPFDESLGAGRRTRGGEDLDYFVRLIRAGIDIAYQPAAIVWHVHRPDEESFRAQVSGYGVGFGAYASKLLLHRSTGFDVLRRIPRGARRLRSETDRAHTVGGVPHEFVVLEWTGMLRGPWEYLREQASTMAARLRRGRSG